MKKKVLAVLLVLAVMVPIAVGAASAPKIWVKGEFVESDVAPVIEEDRTLVPVRFIAEALGFDVAWDQEEYKAEIDKDDIELTIYIDKDEMIKETDVEDGDDIEEIIKLDVPAKIIEDRTFLPLRAVAEAFGEKVDWDNDNRVAIVGEGYVAPEKEEGKEAEAEDKEEGTFPESMVDTKWRGSSDINVEFSSMEPEKAKEYYDEDINQIRSMLEERDWKFEEVEIGWYSYYADSYLEGKSLEGGASYIYNPKTGEICTSTICYSGSINGVSYTNWTVEQHEYDVVSEDVITSGSTNYERVPYEPLGE